MRQLYAREHARIKGVPESLIQGLSETVAHEILGQGIVYEPFRAVGRAIGETLMRVEKARAAVPVSAPDDRKQRPGPGAARERGRAKASIG